MSKSLFILSLPRSLSSEIHGYCRKLMNHQSPAWTTCGEITNSDRFTPQAYWRYPDIPKYMLPGQKPMVEDKVHQILNKYVKADGFVYKDVVQPFIVSAWLSTHPMPAVIIHRNVVDVAYAMWQKQWTYPSNAVPSCDHPKKELLAGLHAAKEVLKTLKGAHIHYEQLVQDETVLPSALKELYNLDHIPSINYLTPSFRQYSKHIDQRKETPLYQELKDLYASLVE